MPAEKGIPCGGSWVCDGQGTCVAWVPVVCRISPTESYEGCLAPDGQNSMHYDIFWPDDPNQLDGICDANTAQHAVCFPGTTCQVVIEPSGPTLHGICE